MSKTPFFADARPGKPVRLGDADYELPILYFRDDCFGGFFAADFARVRAALPSDDLHPVRLLDGRAIVAVVAFNYIETTIGPYGEVGVCVPVTRGRAAPRLLPALLESRYPGFGMVVLHLPVTNAVARDGGRVVWGYPKFVADMDFRITPELQSCRVSEGSSHILTLEVPRGGVLRNDRAPIRTYTVLNGDLVETEIPQHGTYRMSMRPKGARLSLGDHEVSRSIRDLGLSAEPFMTRYFVERAAILPEGRVIGRAARPLEGYRGSDRVGRHAVGYGDAPAGAAPAVRATRERAERMN